MQKQYRVSSIELVGADLESALFAIEKTIIPSQSRRTGISPVFIFFTLEISICYNNFK